MACIGIKQVSRLLVLLFIILLNSLFAQTQNDFFSFQNRIAFGNHLFCEHDYLRAIDEYKSVVKIDWNDSLQFKIATSYYRMDEFDQAYIEFQKIRLNSSIYKQSKLEKLRSLFKSKKYFFLSKEIAKDTSNTHDNLLEIMRLRNSTQLLGNNLLIEKNSFISVFEKEDKSKLSEFYNWKSNPPYKNSTMAAVMSAIIPGTGKFYANEIGDGITAFVLTGLFTYLAVDKFQNNHKTSAWLYASIAAFFYAGNVYGSATAVQNYNAGIKFNFENEVNFFINERNQFLPTPKHLCN